MLAFALVLTLQAAVPDDYAAVRDQGNQASLLAYGAWSVATLGVGIGGIATTHDPLLQGVQIAHLLWGGVNVVIAAISMGVTFGKKGPSGEDPLQEGKNAQLSYSINAVFDVATLAVSAALWQGPGAHDARWQGFAIASLVQSLFLLAYDATMSLYHQLNNARVTVASPAP